MKFRMLKRPKIVSLSDLFQFTFVSIELRSNTELPVAK